MEPTKKPKVKFFKTVSDLKAEKLINEFLSERINRGKKYCND
ncbi:MAG TPA: hypothetical protein VK882_06645 [Nitrososphaeraceae archaeon]|nr:hypothetical protein [Nitrososphaeraceae archaeon]